MDLSAYLSPLKRWWWLLLAGVLLAGVSSYLILSRQPAIYQSRTTLMVGRALDQPNPTSSEFYLEYQLASIYADMANRELFQKAVSQALELEHLPEYIARAIPNTQLVEIIATDTNRARAQAVAAELARQLVLYSPTGNQVEDEERKQFVDSQLIVLQDQINATQAEIEQLSIEMGTMNSARQIAETEEKIRGLETKANTLRTTYANLASTTIENPSNSLRIIEPAELPSVPVGSNRLLIVVLASFFGFAITSLGAYAIEYLDDTLKTPEQVSQFLGSPLGASIVGYIPTIQEKADRLEYVYLNPSSPVADAFRILRTNLSYLSQHLPVNTLLVTSLGVAQGKSTIASNLAVSLSHEDRRTALVDADLRKPSLRNILGANGEKGLSDLFMDGNALGKFPVTLDGLPLMIVPSGPTPPNPVELLASGRMDGIIAELKNCVEVVVFDGPPLFMSDALVLAGKVDGILLVVRLGTVRRKEARLLQEQILQTGIRVLGIVINRAPRSAQYPAYHKYYAAPAKKNTRETA